MKRTLGVTLALLALAIPPGPALAQPVLRLAHIGAPGSLFDLTATEFAETANEALKGRVEIRVSRASQLGTDEQVIRGIKIGVPEMAILSTVMDNIEPRFAIFEMPYLIASRAHMKHVAENKRIQTALFEGLPAKGMRVLGMWENGFRHMTSNVRPIERPEDLKGIRLRVPSGTWRLKMFKAYGASPSPMPLSAVSAALRFGVMDGQENPFSQIASQKFQNVQKYLPLTGHVYSPAYLVISQEAWKKLPPDTQSSLAKIAWELGDFARAEGERLDRELLRKLAPHEGQRGKQGGLPQGVGHHLRGLRPARFGRGGAHPPRPVAAIGAGTDRPSLDPIGRVGKPGSRNTGGCT